jgi:hypothetical protein
MQGRRAAAAIVERAWIGGLPGIEDRRLPGLPRRIARALQTAVLHQQRAQRHR